MIHSAAMPQPKRPLSFPPSQGGTPGGIKKLAKTCPRENGERSFYKSNTIDISRHTRCTFKREL